MPKNSAVATHTSSRNANTVQSNATSCMRGMRSEPNATSRLLVHRATSTPARPPASASSRLSIMNCRTSRARDAPSAALVATSCIRLLVSASSRFATLAHAAISTSATAPKSSQSERRVGPSTASAYGTTLRTLDPLHTGVQGSAMRLRRPRSLQRLRRRMRPASAARSAGSSGHAAAGIPRSTRRRALRSSRCAAPTPPHREIERPPASRRRP